MLLKANSLTEKQLMQGCVDRDPKCQKGVFKKGYEVGTPEYKNCILKKGRE